MTDNDQETEGMEEQTELLDVLERGIRQLVADKHTGWPLILVK